MGDDHGWGFYVFGVGSTRNRLAEALAILEDPRSTPLQLEYAGSVLKARRSTIEHCIEGGHFRDPEVARGEHRRALDLLGRLEARIGAEVGRASDEHMHRVDGLIRRLRTQAEERSLILSVESKLAGR